jgi:hypothetical protein
MVGREPERLELLRFPTLYPIKVVCEQSPDIRRRVDATVRRFIPALKAEQISERLSSEGRFVSITYAVVVASADQVRALLQAVLAEPGVKLAI